MRKMRSFRDALIEDLRSDPEEMRAFLEVVLEEYENDHDQESFLFALRTVIDAYGGISKLSRETGLSRQSLYKALSAKGNPRLDTLLTVLQALGLRLALQQR